MSDSTFKSDEAWIIHHESPESPAHGACSSQMLYSKAALYSNHIGTLPLVERNFGSAIVSFILIIPYRL
jgi:hypothetical protein